MSTTTRSRAAALSRVVLRPADARRLVEYASILAPPSPSFRNAGQTRITFRAMDLTLNPRRCHRADGATMCSACPSTRVCRKKSMTRPTRFQLRTRSGKQGHRARLCQTRHRAGSWTSERRAHHAYRSHASRPAISASSSANLECRSSRWIYDVYARARITDQASQPVCTIACPVVPHVAQSGSARPAHLRYG